MVEACRPLLALRRKAIGREGLLACDDALQEARLTNRGWAGDEQWRGSARVDWKRDVGVRYAREVRKRELEQVHQRGFPLRV